MVAGSGTTTINGSAWFVGATEPANWMISAADTTAVLQAPGAVGVYTYVSASSTNAPVKTLIDNLLVAKP